MLIKVKDKEEASHVVEWTPLKDHLGNDVTEILDSKGMKIADISGVSFLIASIDKPAFQTANDMVRLRHDEMKRNFKNITDKDAIEAELAFNVAVGCHLIQGWDGLKTENEKGEKVPFVYSVENAELLATQTEIAHSIVMGVYWASIWLSKKANAAKAELLGK